MFTKNIQTNIIQQIFAWVPSLKWYRNSNSQRGERIGKTGSPGSFSGKGTGCIFSTLNTALPGVYS